MTTCRICVTNDVEMRKCETMKLAAYSRDIRPEFECILNSKCAQAVKDNKMDVTIVPGAEYNEARKNNLKPIMYETRDPNEKYVAVADKGVTDDQIEKFDM